MTDPALTYRRLTPGADRDLVRRLYEEARDFWILTERRPPDAAMVEDFFASAPPGCPPEAARREAVFLGNRPVGALELAFGWPAAGDAFLGLLFLVPDARGLALGPAILSHVEALARAGGAPALYLAVLEENPRAMAFWQRMGFTPTGVMREDAETGHRIHRLGKRL